MSGDSVWPCWLFPVLPFSHFQYRDIQLPEGLYNTFSTRQGLWVGSWTKSYSLCLRSSISQKAKPVSENQSHGNKHEMPALGLQGAVEKGWESPHCRIPFQPLPSATLPGGGHSQAGELKWAPTLVTEVSRWHVPYTWPHSAGEGYQTECISRICPVSSCLPDNAAYIWFPVQSRMDPESDQQIAMGATFSPLSTMG